MIGGRLTPIVASEFGKSGAMDEDMWFVALTGAIIVTLIVLGLVYGFPDFSAPQ